MTYKRPRPPVPKLKPPERPTPKASNDLAARAAKRARDKQHEWERKKAMEEARKKRQKLKIAQ